MREEVVCPASRDVNRAALSGTHSKQTYARSEAHNAYARHGPKEHQNGVPARPWVRVRRLCARTGRLAFGCCAGMGVSHSTIPDTDLPCVPAGSAQALYLPARPYSLSGLVRRRGRCAFRLPLSTPEGICCRARRGTLCAPGTDSRQALPVVCWVSR